MTFPSTPCAGWVIIDDGRTQLIDADGLMVSEIAGLIAWGRPDLDDHWRRQIDFGIDGSIVGPLRT